MNKVALNIFLSMHLKNIYNDHVLSHSRVQQDAKEQSVYKEKQTNKT